MKTCMFTSTFKQLQIFRAIISFIFNAIYRKVHPFMMDYFSFFKKPAYLFLHHKVGSFDISLSITKWMRRFENKDIASRTFILASFPISCFMTFFKPCFNTKFMSFFKPPFFAFWKLFMSFLKMSLMFFHNILKIKAGFRAPKRKRLFSPAPITASYRHKKFALSLVSIIITFLFIFCQGICFAQSGQIRINHEGQHPLLHRRVGSELSTPTGDTITIKENVGIINPPPAGDKLYVAGNTGISGNLTIGGTTTLKDITFASDNAYDIGDTTNHLRNINISGTIDSSDTYYRIGSHGGIDCLDFEIYSQNASNYIKWNGTSATPTLEIAGKTSISSDLTIGGTLFGGSTLEIGSDVTVASDLTLVGTNTGIFFPDDTYQTTAAGAGAGDNVTVNAGAVDTTANIADGGDLDWTLTDGGAGGPDDITAVIKNDVIDTSNFVHSQDFGDINTDAAGTLRFVADSIDNAIINWTNIDYLDNEGAVDIAAYPAVGAFASGDTFLILEAGVGIREADYDDLPAAAATAWDDIGDSDAATTISMAGNDHTFSNVDDFTFLSTTSSKPRLIIEADNVGANTGPILKFFHDTSSPADDDDAGKIEFSNDDSANNGTLFAYILGEAEDVSDGAESGSLDFVVALNSANSSLLLLDGYNGTPGQGTIKFNEDSKDVDFSVETDSTDDFFKIDGGADTLSISGATTISSDLTLVGTNTGIFFPDDTYQTTAAGAGATEINVLLKPQSAKLPTSNPAVIGAGNSGWRLLFDDTTQETATWEFILDDDYGSGTLYADVYFSMASGEADEVQWEVYVMAVTATTDNADWDTDSYDTENVGVTTVAATAGRPYKQTITLTNDDSLAAGDMIRIKISTDSDDAVNDDASGDREFRHAVIRE